MVHTVTICGDIAMSFGAVTHEKSGVLSTDIHCLYRVILGDRYSRLYRVFDREKKTDHWARARYNHHLVPHTPD